MPLARMIGPISVWAMDQLESIPVFRNTPSKLNVTMRMSVEALQAGDNLLIFPENPDADYQGHGYARGKVGTMFTGFATIGHLYWRRTGKRCRFLPVYAHQRSRTITFGDEILFDPDRPLSEECERIAAEATRQMEAICAAEDAKIEQRKKRK